MSLYTEWAIPEEVLIELGSMSIEDNEFTYFIHDLSDLGFILEYQEDRDLDSEKEFQDLVRIRWNAMKRAWVLRSRGI